MSNIVYDMVVRCEIDGEEKNFYFDYVENNTTNLSSDICTHPLVNGDIIADHMYVNPATVSFGGTFSLLGNKKADKNYNFGSSDRLANIQKMFERIMKEGISCTLVKMGQDGDQSRFKVRNNMVLNNITWIEHQSSVDFSFSFYETLTADVSAEVEYKLNESDDTLPIVTDPNILSVTDTLIDENDIYQILLNTLKENEVVDDEFLTSIFNYCSTIDSTSSSINTTGTSDANKGLTTAAVGVAIGVITALTLVFGVGAVIAVVAALVSNALFIVGVVSFFKSINKSKYKIKPFKNYKSEKKLNKEIKRFLEFYGEMCIYFDDLYKKMYMYGFGKNDIQKCFVTIDNDNYIFNFTKSTRNSNYSLSVTSIDGSNKANVSNIAEKAIANIGECNKSNILFTTSSGCQVYLVNRQLYSTIEKKDAKLENISIINKSSANAIMIDETRENKFNEEVESVKKDLTNYAILSSTVDLTNFNNIIIDIIKTQILE